MKRLALTGLLLAALALGLAAAATVDDGPQREGESTEAFFHRMATFRIVQLADAVNGNRDSLQALLGRIQAIEILLVGNENTIGHSESIRANERRIADLEGENARLRWRIEVIERAQNAE